MNTDLSFTCFRNYEYKDLKYLYTLLRSMVEKVENELLEDGEKEQLYKKIDELHAHMRLELGSMLEALKMLEFNFPEVYQPIYDHGDKINNLVGNIGYKG
jgi:hypothetical protein